MGAKLIAQHIRGIGQFGRYFSELQSKRSIDF